MNRREIHRMLSSIAAELTELARLERMMADTCGSQRFSRGRISGLESAAHVVSMRAIDYRDSAPAYEHFDASATTRDDIPCPHLPEPMIGGGQRCRVCGSVLA